MNFNDLQRISNAVRLDDPDFAKRHVIRPLGSPKSRVRAELFKRVIARIEKHPVAGKRIHAELAKNPQLVSVLARGNDVSFESVNGMGEVDQHMGVWSELFSAIGTKAFEFGVNREIAKKQSNDAIELETKKMNAALEIQRKQALLDASKLSAQAKTDKAAAAQQLAILQKQQDIVAQQNALKEINSEIGVKKWPLIIGGVAAVGALALSLFKRRKA